MAGFQIPTPGGLVTIQARQLPDGSWKQEIDIAPARKTPIGPAERISVGTGAVSTLSPPAGATQAELFVENASDIRYYNEGSTPTTAVGVLLPLGQAFELDYTTFANWKMIAVTATVIVNVLYYKYGA